MKIVLKISGDKKESPIFSKIPKNDQVSGAWSAPTSHFLFRPNCAKNDQAGPKTTRSGHTDKDYFETLALPDFKSMLFMKKATIDLLIHL